MIGRREVLIGAAAAAAALARPARAERRAPDGGAGPDGGDPDTRVPISLPHRVWVADGADVLGPFDARGLADRLKTQETAARTFVWMQGMDGWALATDVPALTELVSGLPLNEIDALDPKTHLVGHWEMLMAQAGEGTRTGHMTFRADGSYALHQRVQGLAPEYSTDPKTGAQTVKLTEVDNNLTEKGTWEYRDESGVDWFWLYLKGDRDTVLKGPKDPRGGAGKKGGKSKEDYGFALRFLPGNRLYNLDTGHTFIKTGPPS
ncbi:DUF4339 domain-containing protein [Rhodobacteraceae bacterium CCMM004]|nr:DUF4339 domain-containing protein [Rhodobacteraceae bacterium CCMM004]